MEDTDEEKVQLLESIRLQDAALSMVIDDSIASINSDSDDDVCDEVDQPTVISETCSSVSEPLNIVKDNKSAFNEEVSKEPTWGEALEANQEYDAVLAQLEEEIKQNIAKVKKELADIHSKISIVSNQSASVNMKSHYLYVFGMPYFKTETLYPCPNNEDYHRKKRNQEICWPDLPPYHQWVLKNKKQLNQAVRKLSYDKCLEEAQLKLAVLRKEFNIVREAGNSERASQLEKEIEEFDVEKMAQSMVDDVIANNDHDWMQISAKFLDGRQSPETCRSFWYLYLHPNINKKPYTEVEETKLIELAEKYKHQDWESIAKELGTNRSGYQCFIVYQNKLNTAVKKCVWTAEEDKKLIETVKKYRIGDFIPWPKVAYYMEGRTKSQVFTRWAYSLNPAIRKGRFTQEEDIMILVGVHMWGEDFTRISNFLRDRTTSQVRDRYQHYLNRADLGIPWTIENDKLLLQLAEEHGKNWAEICKRFPSKDRTQVRHRYTTIVKWMEKNPGAPLTEAPARLYNPQHYKEFQEQWEKAKAILDCGSVEEMVKAKNELVSSIVKRKNSFNPSAKKEKKRQSPMEIDLLNYFRCSFDLPGGHRKLNVRAEEAMKYADEVTLLLQLLKAKINLPSIEDIQEDSSLCSADKDILTSMITNDVFSYKPPLQTQPMFEVSSTATEQLFSDDNNSNSAMLCDDRAQSLDPGTNIDYIPPENLDSLYVDLPLRDFSQIEIVTDRNRDPSFYEPSPIRDTLCEAENPPSLPEIYVCPPNLTTLIGLRTYLLNRRNLIAWTNASSGKNVKSSKAISNDKLKDAERKLDERLLSLFLWPALMSRNKPASNRFVFMDDEGTKKSGASSHQQSTTPTKKSKKGKKGAKEITQINAQVRDLTSLSGKIPEKASFDAGIPSTSRANPSGPRISKLPPKKRKVIVESDNDSDPDDPSTSEPPSKKCKT